MSQHASTAPRRPLLVFSRDNFDDYWTALLSDCRSDDVADHVYTGSLQHPLLTFQVTNAEALQALEIQILPATQFDLDPLDIYSRFLDQVHINNGVQDHPADPALPALTHLLSNGLNIARVNAFSSRVPWQLSALVCQ